MRFSFLGVSSILLWGHAVAVDYSRQECTDAGGVIVGDIGDGAIFQPGFTCSTNGQPPIANVVAGPDEPIASEGEVCCGAAGDVDGGTQTPEDGTVMPINDTPGLPIGSSTLLPTIDDGTSDPLSPPIDDGTADPLDEGTSDPLDDGTSDPSRPEMSRDECEDQGGIITQDIGDGSIHRPDYICDGSELPPIGTVIPLDGEPIAREGEVCCPDDGNSTSIPIDDSSTSLPIDDGYEWNEMSSDECLEMGGAVVGILDDNITVADICLDTETPIGVIVDSETARQAGQSYCCATGNMTVMWPNITRADCEAMDGVIEGDIGDGATQSPDYLCRSDGLPPIGTVVADEGEPVAIEGEVCCGKGPTEEPTDLPDDGTEEPTDLPGDDLPDDGTTPPAPPGTDDSSANNTAKLPLSLVFGLAVYVINF